MNPFVCEMCDRSFTVKRNLTSHMKTVHENVRYACEICGFQFTRIGHLIDHQTSDEGKSKCIINVKRRHLAAKATTPPPTTAPPSSASVSSFLTTTSSSVLPTQPPSSTIAVPQPPPSSSSSEPLMIFCDGCNVAVRKNYWSYHLRTNSHKQSIGGQIERHGFVLHKSLFKERIETLIYINSNKTQLIPEVFLKEVEPSLHLILFDILVKHISIKWNLELFCEYIKMVDEKAQISIKSHQTKMIPLITTSDIEETIGQKFQEILVKMSEFQERDSGWTLVRIMHIELNVNQYRPI